MFVVVRGYDIANHLCEWMYEYHVDRPPYFRAIFEEYPTREQQRAFCERYLQVCDWSIKFSLSWRLF